MKHTKKNIGIGYLYRGLYIRKDYAGNGTSSYTPYTSWSIKDGLMFEGIEIPKGLKISHYKIADAVKEIDKALDKN